MMRKFAFSKFSFRVNSGHPLFIGEGRTGENPIFSATIKDTVTVSFFSFTCLIIF